MKNRFRPIAVVLVLLAFTANVRDGESRQQVAAGLAAGSEGAPGPASQGPVLQERYPRYRLRAGDVLDVNFSFTPEFNQSVTVQPDGYINLRGLGDMRVQGKTTPELVETLRSAYGKILHDPVLTVELKDFEKPYFIVGGEVTHPGKYDLRGDTTVLQAVAIAGHFNGQSKSSQVLLFRRVSDEWVEVTKLNIKQMIRNRNVNEDVHLRPGDMVFVPKSNLARLERFIPVPSVGLYANPFGF
jgi:polysaccharide export outer membrane protein